MPLSTVWLLRSASALDLAVLVLVSLAAADVTPWWAALVPLALALPVSLALRMRLAVLEVAHAGAVAMARNGALPSMGRRDRAKLLGALERARLD